MTRILVIWGNWGPYHYARFSAFRKAGQILGYDIEGLELFSSSGYYDWEITEVNEGVHHIDIGQVESRFHPWRMTCLALPKIRSLRPDVVFVPSYWHWSLYINLVTRLWGSRIVMMNESHGGTEKAKGWKRVLKKGIVRCFHAALVGGTPHRDYFAGLGLDSHRIFTGYDAVDNAYFASKSDEARARATEFREKLGIPERYFLSLGRMVEKKNLSLLIDAYSRFRENNPTAEQHLVLVGAGEEEPALRALCLQNNLPIKEAIVARSPGISGDQLTAVASSTATAVADGAPSVHFFGFRQIQQNPVFYALADGFILPSHTEEWGLVVNEAMACGLPVLVSRNVGCARDLVSHGENGFLFDPGSPAELASHLETLARNPEQQEAMGRNSAERVAAWGCDNFARNGLRAAEAALK